MTKEQSHESGTWDKNKQKVGEFVKQAFTPKDYDSTKKPEVPKGDKPILVKVVGQNDQVDKK